jgi:tetratricopeptide (TPR) repeat protein
MCSFPRWAVPVAVFLLLVAAAAGYFWYAKPGADGLPTIAIIRAPSGGDPARSEALARSISVEVAATQSAASGTFDLRESVGGGTVEVDYLVQVAASPPGAMASADLSLLASQGREILWTGHFEKPGAEESDLRLQAAARLQAVLACLVEADNASGKPLDLPTLKLFLRACERFSDSIGGLEDKDALGLLRQVVDRAPRFAPAIADLALVEANALREAPARALIARAKALDPTLAKIYIAETELLPRSKWRARQAALAEGLRRNPDAASLHNALAFDLSQVGLRNDAIVSARRAVEIDPSSPRFRATLAQVLTYAGQIKEADEVLRKAERIWPTSTTVSDIRWSFDLRVGDPVRALKELEKDETKGAFSYTGTRIPEAGNLKLFLEARIDPTPANIEKAIEAHRAKVRLEPHHPGTLLIALAIFDRVDQAYAALAHPAALPTQAENTGLFFRSYFKKFRQDPRFMPFAARLGLVRYWTETGKWPDFCFEPDLPYDCKVDAAKLKAAGKVV